MQIIRDFFNNHHIDLTRPLAVGVSGGADSLAVMLMLKEEFPELRLIALTVDHRLRPASADEARYVASVAAKYDIEHHTLVWSGEKPTTGIEEKARIARYRLLCQWCQEHQIAAIVLAHHLFDQAETFLMRLQRGSGLYGLSAMDDVSVKGGILLLRPFLSVNPDYFKQYLQTRQLTWIEDESNQCMNFLRVKMRRFLPVMAEATGIDAAKIFMATHNLQRTKSFLEDTIAQVINTKVRFWGESGCSFDYTEFLSWHDELKFHILNRLIRLFGGNDYAPEAESLLNLTEKVQQKDFSVQTLGDCLIIRQDLCLWIVKEYRQQRLPYSADMWEKFIVQNPSVRGIKIPQALREALLNEK